MRYLQNVVTVVGFVAFVCGSGCSNSHGRRSRVSSVSPATGLESGGTSITITGTGFRPGATVSIGGAPATSVVVVSTTTITAVTPAGTVGAADLQVANGGRSMSLAGGFTFLDSAPSITSLTPEDGSETGGTLVTLTGSNFFPDSVVTIGGSAATSVNVVDEQTITVITPVGVVGTADVVVTTSEGTGTLADGFTYLLAEIFITNSSADTLTVYDKSDDGNAPPSRKVEGASTGLSGLIGLTVAGDEIFVANIGIDAVTVYGRGDTGDVAPARTLVGGSTGLVGPTGVYVDLTAGELMVANVFNDSVTVYNLDDDGDVAPKRTISGGLTELDSPEGVFGLDGELFVCNGNGDSLVVFNVEDDGNVAPLRRISGGSTGFSSPQGLFVSNGEIFIANAIGARITVHAADANGDVAPLRTISGGSTGLVGPQAVYTTFTEIFVANGSGDSITVYGINDTGNVAPQREITGGATDCLGPEGIVVR